MSEPAPTTPEGVARTPTGEIASQTQTTTPAATTPQTSTTPTETPSLANQPPTDPSLASQKPAPEPPKGEGAPTEYAKFNVPEGYELDTEVAKEASAIFKGMNLSQTQAQKLVDFYTAKTNESVNQPYQLWQDTQEQWVKEVKSDPVLGPKLNEVKTTIARAIDGLGDPKLANDFRAAMDYTGAGNNPSFIRAFYKLAQMVTEGGHVAGGGPSPASQRREGQVPSAAQAMYPNLPSGR